MATEPMGPFSLSCPPLSIGRRYKAGKKSHSRSLAAAVLRRRRKRDTDNRKTSSSLFLSMCVCAWKKRNLLFFPLLPRPSVSYPMRHWGEKEEEGQKKKRWWDLSGLFRYRPPLFPLFPNFPLGYLWARGDSATGGEQKKRGEYNDCLPAWRLQ